MKAARAAVVALLALTAAGLYAGGQQWIRGDAVTDLHTIGAGGAVWGLYVVGDGFFASVALAGLAIACLIRVLRARGMEAVAQRGVLLALAGLAASVVCVLADLGRPAAAVIYLPLVGRARAPFFGTFTLVAGASLFASAVQLVLASRPAWAQRAQAGGARFWRALACGWQGTESARRRRARVDFWLSLALLPLLALGFVVLGCVFGAGAGRPAWLARLQAVTFVVSGGAAACSLLLLAVALNSTTEHTADTEAGKQKVRSQVRTLFPFRSVSVSSVASVVKSGARPPGAALARVLALLTSLTVLLVVAGQILALRTPSLSAQRYAYALLAGPWSGLFWAELVLFFVAASVCVARFWRGEPSLFGAAATTLFVCAAVFIQRFLSLVAWQTHGLSLPWPTGSYHPTWVEWEVVVGIAAAAALAFSLLVKLCPAVTSEPAGLSGPEGRGRRFITTTCLLIGLAFASAGLALSGGLGSGRFLDPILPGSPLLFLGGLFLMLSAPLLYELVPERPRPESQ